MNNLILTQILLQAGEGGMGPNVVMFGAMIAIFAVFYFLLIRPQRKKQKEMKVMLENLKKGDKVATIGGIRGTVSNVKEKTVVVKVDDNAKIEFSKDAVAALLSGSDGSDDGKN